jgi:FkbM family methyltransferase
MDQSQSNFTSFEAKCKSLKHVDIPKISKNKPIYIFGAGGFGKSILNALRENNFDVAGFIETNPKNTQVDGLPIYSWTHFSEEPFSAQIIIGIFNRDVAFDGLINIARTAGFKDIIMPWDVYSQFSDELGWRYWLSCKDVILDATDEIKKTFQILSDEESKKTLLNICEFRLGLNNSFASFKHEDNQYFNSITLSQFVDSSNCVYVDCGAYNGDTFIEADGKLPLGKAYLFEPDFANFEQLVKTVKSSNTSTVCLPLAVSDQYQILSLSGSGEGSTIASNGSVHIAAASLDELMPNSRVNFIKFDVEGSEVPAVMGAKHLIQRSRPIIVLSLYHRPADLWEIPALIASYCPDYKFYIRQHFNNSFDSVFYAIPQ